MPRHASYVPHGVIPAVLLPFHDDLSIDEASYRSHLRDVASSGHGLGLRSQKARNSSAYSRGRMQTLPCTYPGASPAVWERCRPDRIARRTAAGASMRR